MANILIIENNLMNLEMATELLSVAGHNVLKSENASDGIKLARLKSPDLILMDLSLPVMDGLSATRILKQDLLTEKIPVVAFTAMVMDSDREKAFGAGCSGFISKPIDISTFVSLVESHLETRTEKSNSCEYQNIYSDHSEKILDSQYKWHKILVVDDNPMNAELLKEILEQINQSSFIAYSGKQALKAVSKETFDLILLDVMMPEMSGFEVIEYLKSDPKTKDIPVIFITALNETDDIIKGLNLGSYEYIVKPFNIDELKARIINTLEIKDLQDQLREEKNKLDLIFRFSADGIVMLNSSFKIISCNERFIQWFGSNKEDILGRDFYEFFNCYCREPNYCSSLEFFGLNSFSEISVKNENGEKIYQINYSKVFENESETEGYVLVLRDITEHKEVEKQKETFVATLTHDLKTPIRAEIMAMELLLKGNFGKLTNEQTDIVRDTLYSSKYMFSMVDNLLSTYRYENGNISLNKEDTDIISLIKTCCNELKYLIEDKNHLISFEFMEISIIVSVDILELKRVITNLLINAVSYTHEYGKIVIKSEIVNNEIQISFIDNGKGISKQDISRLFNKYTSQAKRFRQVGTGLGLYLSKQIIEAHGGSISVESEENKGSKFTFSLPLVPSLVI